MNRARFPRLRPFLALGALIHRLDPGVIPFRKATTCSIHVSGGEFNTAANLADCFGLRTGVASAMVEYPIGELIARLDEVPRQGRVVCVCRVGARSAQVAAYLVQQGYDAVNLDGGLAAWAATGRPMVSDTGQPAAVI